MTDWGAAVSWLLFAAALLWLLIIVGGRLARHWQQPPPGAVVRFDYLVHRAVRSENPTEIESDALICAQLEQQLNPRHTWHV